MEEGKQIYIKNGSSRNKYETYMGGGGINLFVQINLIVIFNTAFKVEHYVHAKYKSRRSDNMKFFNSQCGI